VETSVKVDMFRLLGFHSSAKWCMVVFGLVWQPQALQQVCGCGARVASALQKTVCIVMQVATWDKRRVLCCADHIQGEYQLLDVCHVYVQSLLDLSATVLLYMSWVRAAKQTQAVFSSKAAISFRR